MTTKHTPEPWRIEKLHTRRVIRGANSSLVGVIESGMSDEDAARLEQRLSTTAHADPAKALELAREAIELGVELLTKDRAETNEDHEELHRTTIDYLERALAALTPEEEK